MLVARPTLAGLFVYRQPAGYDRDMTRKRRTIYAFLFAPLIVPIFFAFWTVVTNRTFAPMDMLSTLTVDIGYTLPFAYAAELIFGLPAWWAFRRYRISSRLAFALAGCVIGWAVGSIFAREPNPFSANWAIRGGPLFAIAGLLSSCMFREIRFPRSTSS
jgi:hypothetical protein